MRTSELTRFLLITFVLGMTAQFVGIRAGLSDSGQTWLRVAMWIPALATLSSRPARRAVGAALRASGRWWLPLGLVVGWAPILLQSILLLLVRGGAWNAVNFPLGPDGRGVAEIRDLGVLLGSGPQGFAHFALNLLLSLTVGSVITGVFEGLGEEIGWRAVLQPEMERRLGALGGSLVTGLIWAYWHLPANLAGYNDATHPVLNALLTFPILVTSMALAYGWMVRRSRSVWPAALAHGAYNCIVSGFVVSATTWRADVATALAAAVLIGAIVLLLDRRVLLPGSTDDQRM